MRRIACLSAACALLVLFAAAPVFAAPATNDTCLECHAPGGSAFSETDFGVGVDYSGCVQCHSYGVHDFDVFHVAQNAAPDYMSQQCNSCHHSSNDFSYRPAILGWPTVETPEGWFQSADSPESTPEDIHGIHVNGSWLKDQQDCAGCHGAASCDACHGSDVGHEEHASLGTQELAATRRIGRNEGDACPDTYIYSYRPTTAYASGTALYVGATSAGEERILMRFPLAKLGTATASKATLNLFSTRTVAFPLRAYRLRRSDWDAAQANWNAYRTGSAWGLAGAKSPTLDYHASPYAESSSGTFDVTALLQAAVADGAAYLDVLIVDPAPVKGRYDGFYSSETIAPEYRPSLEIDVTEPRTAYAYGPVPAGQPYPSYVTADRSCVADACHGLADAATSAFAPECTSCHADRAQAHGYDAAMHLANLSGQTLSGVLTDRAGNPFREYTAGELMEYAGLGCGECHLMDLMDEHSKPSSSSAALGCAACHPTARGSFESWNGTCGQGDCHPSYHGGMSDKHYQNYSGFEESCGAASSNCHLGGWKPDLAAIHYEPWYAIAWWADLSDYPYGCPICHTSASAVPETPSNCRTCHPSRHWTAVFP